LNMSKSKWPKSKMGVPIRKQLPIFEANLRCSALPGHSL
jgi:hypothetical protein